MLKNCRMRLLARSVAAALLAAPLLTGCSSHPAHSGPAPPAPAAAPSVPLPATGVYRVDPTQSEVRLLVYRSGPLARLGHDHVIINRDISGTARMAPAAFSLTIPVAGFVVDDVQARSEEGADFSTEVSEDARSGTLRNMLSAELLDAARFATLTLDSVSVVVAGNLLTSTLSLNVAGHRSTVVVPFTMMDDGGRLVAIGRVTLRQSLIGLTPFRAALGALAVQDEFDVKFKIVATPQ